MARTLFGILLLLSAAEICKANESKGNSKIVYDFWKCASPTSGFWGLNYKLAPSGIYTQQ
jgi:hypothetical protein